MYNFTFLCTNLQQYFSLQALNLHQKKNGKDMNSFKSKPNLKKISKKNNITFSLEV